MIQPCTAPLTIGLLHPGEMGSALAGILRSQGHRVIATLAGRSARTRELCLCADLETRDTLSDVVGEADLILSVVTPGSAEDVALEVANVLDRMNVKDRIYLDANSVSPATMRAIDGHLSEKSVNVVDVTIHGQASRLESQGTVFASGRRADVVERLLGNAIRVKNLGGTIGKASMQKMLLGSMSKGIIALFLQTSLAAEKSDLTADFLEDLARYYPDLVAFVERSLPSYPRHARRRSEEMREWESTLAELKLRRDLAGEVRRLFSELADSGISEIPASPENLPLAAQVKWIAAESSLLVAEPATPQYSIH